ncbi:MAG: hypothetical protein AAGJ83_15315, partial [Planctomycetota bacterium]
CFFRGPVPWYIVLVSYGFGLTIKIFDVISDATGDAEEVGVTVGRSIVQILFSAGIWAWLHGDAVKEYYGVDEEPLWRVITFDLLGVGLAVGLGVALLMLA